jgi:hypothetical protein
LKYLLLGIAMTGVMFAGPKALGRDVLAPNQSVVNKRQMIGCMTKRMSASRTVSYNDAKKACTAQLKPQTDGVPHPLTAAR